MKKQLILFLSCAAMCAVLFSSYSTGPGSAGGLERTGVTGSGGCGGSTCHGMAPSASPTAVIMVIDASTMMPVSSYTPFHNYLFRIIAENTSSAILPKFGYQLTAMVGSSTTANAGILSASIGSHNVIIGGVKLTEHSSPLAALSGSGGSGTIYQVDVPWTAPSPGTGDVTVRSIVNAVNNSGSADAGDMWTSGTPLILPEGPSPIGGPASVCLGSVTPLSASPAGGAWSSSNPAVASVSSFGMLTAVSLGTATISYVSSAGTATRIVTVNPNPGPITGATMVCAGGSITLANSTPGGVWSSSSAATATVSAASGVVTGVSGGSAIITYMLPSGCSDTALVTITAVEGIAGPGTVCIGAPVTLSHPTAGGTWSSSSAATATVSTGGVVTGVAAGTATISYSLAGGCLATKVVTVASLPSAAVTGPSTVCATQTITLSGTPAGGAWSSLTMSTATVGASTGIVSGVLPGAATIKYKVTNACGSDSTTKAVTVTPATPCTTGIGNPFAFTNELKLYPNPNNGTFSLNVLSTIDEHAHVVVTNIVGSRVREFDLKTNQANNISLQQPAGIYFLAVSTLSNKYFVKVVVE